MNCTESQESVLEADGRELRGAGDSALARHLRTCARCRALADRILEDQSHLRGALAALTPPGPADHAARVAARHARWRWWRTRALVPGVAAAAVAALMLLPRTGTLPPAPPAARLPTPLVEANQDQDLIVYHTANPDIVVVWQY